MDKKFLIEGEEVAVCEKEIKTYYRLYDDCYHKNNGQLCKFEGDLFISEDKEIIDCNDCTRVLPEHTYDEQGIERSLHSDFYTRDSAQGFVHKGKLYLLSMLEEVQTSRHGN